MGPFKPLAALCGVAVALGLPVGDGASLALGTSSAGSSGERWR